MNIKNKKLLYHLTTLDSFESIVKYGLLSRQALNRLGIKFTDTADHAILKERERMNLEGYIPFHFHIHTAYDTVVKKTHNDKEFIYLCLHRQYAQNNNFKILPVHPASSGKPQLYDYDEGFSKIDWETMEMTKQTAKEKGVDENYRCQVRMAECLVPRSIKINEIFSICVKNEDIKNAVEKILRSNNIVPKPHIDIINYF